MGKFDSIVNNNTGKDFINAILRDIDSRLLLLISVPIDKIEQVRGEIKGLAKTLEVLTSRTVKMKTELGD